MTSTLGGQTAVTKITAPIRRALVVAALLASAGCGPLGVGKLGKYRFSIDMPTEKPSVRSDFAFLVGTEATVIVDPMGASGGLEKIASSNPSVLEILSHDRRRAAVRAVKAGDATLWATGANGEDVVRADDVESLGVADVSKLVLGEYAGTQPVLFLVPTVTVNGVREPLASGQVELRVRTPDVCEEGSASLGVRVPEPGRPRLHTLVPKAGRSPGPTPSCEAELVALGKTAQYSGAFPPAR